MNITRSRVREAIARAEARNPLATELDRTGTRIEAGDLYVLVEAAKCARFKWAKRMERGIEYRTHPDPILDDEAPATPKE